MNSLFIPREEWMKALRIDIDSEYVRDEALLKQMDSMEKLLLDTVRAKETYRLLDINAVPLSGKSINRHLEHCEKVIVMAVTLGAEVDMLIKQQQAKDMYCAVLIDTGASIMVDIVADNAEAAIKEKTGVLLNWDGGVYMTSRFSPGYGDYPITMQKKIVGLVNGTKEIGLHVTAESLMIPRKSVTALIGVSRSPVTGHLATCSECVLKDKCEKRKRGEYCGN